MAIDTPQSLALSRKQLAGRAGIETLVYSYYDAVYRLALSFLESESEAEDATQETFIAAAGALDDYRGEAQLKTWLFAIAINQCRQQIRKRRQRERLKNAVRKVHALFEPPTLPEEAVAESERNYRLHAAVSALPEKQRLPILLRYVHNFTAPEIAAVLNVSEGTVYSRLYYARRQLRHLLGE